MQELSSIKHYPLDLSEHGLTPKGMPMFRIVWADSRIEKVGLGNEMHQIHLYDGKANGKWVLEKWLPVEKLVGMTREQYEELLTGPMFGGVQMEYPVDGDYEMVAVFKDSVTPAYAHQLCSMVNCDQANFTNAERAQALRESLEKKEAETEEAKDNVIMNALNKETPNASS